MSSGVTFILAPREMSSARIRDLLKKYLVRTNILFGIAQEGYIQGFENQPQFRTLDAKFINSLAAKSNGRIKVVKYAQGDSLKVINSANFTRAIIINGSFHRSFHLRPEYQAIIDKGAKVKYEPPFLDEAEAKAFALSCTIPAPNTNVDIDDVSAFSLIRQESVRAFITDFQNAAMVVKAGKVVSLAHNAVVPYETYAWHYGLSREKHQCPPGDSSQYDTIHAETAALIEAGPKAKGSTLYIRTFPCPHCARNIAYAGVSEIVYELDYGDKYGYNLLDKASIKYRRFHAG